MQIIDARGRECLEQALYYMKAGRGGLNEGMRHVSDGNHRALLMTGESNLSEAIVCVNGVLGSIKAYEQTRITVSPDQMGGVPCVRGLRIPVSTILAAYVDGLDDAAIMAEYPDLTPEDLVAAVEYVIETVNRSRESL